MRFLINHLFGQLHQLFGKLHVVCLWAALLGYFGRRNYGKTVSILSFETFAATVNLTVKPTLRASRGGVHRADTPIKLALAERLQAHAHAVAQQRVRLMNVNVRLRCIYDTWVHSICEDVGVRGGQVASQVLGVQESGELGAGVLLLRAVVLLQLVDVLESRLLGCGFVQV